MINYKPEWDKMTADEKADMLKSNFNDFVRTYNDTVVRLNSEVSSLKASLQEISQKEKTPA